MFLLGNRISTTIIYKIGKVSRTHYFSNKDKTDFHLGTAIKQKFKDVKEGDRFQIIVYRK